MIAARQFSSFSRHAAVTLKSASRRSTPVRPRLVVSASSSSGKSNGANKLFGLNVVSYGFRPKRQTTDQSQKRFASSDGGGGGGGGSKGGSGGGGEGGSGGGSGEEPKSLWQAYLLALERDPLMTKMITSGVMNAIGDLGCQLGFEGIPFKDLDWKRVGIFTVLGFGLVGPALHTWYGVLYKVVGGSGTKATLLRLLLDQGVFAPFFISLFTSSLFALQGTPELIVPKLKQDLFNTSAGGSGKRYRTRVDSVPLMGKPLGGEGLIRPTLEWRYRGMQ
ncbi:hypothetical protein CYMTET_12053 [Cymbomonas tetramitiformis]|uniref:Uncharacterized protein n=1 Tax=Cymbomonas tetramitiformis TaxID=36881 RepID=A0AAE0GL56_9CHLO|nr:hypothetical protein CYMTET_12053 [Cymbomonas tetramitiformis]